MNSLLFLSPGLALIPHAPHGRGDHYLLYLHLPESQLKLFPWTSSNSCTAIKALIWKSLNSVGFEVSQHICFIPVEMTITFRIVVGILVRSCWWWETNIQGNFHKIILEPNKKQNPQSAITILFFCFFFQTFVGHIFCDDDHLSSPWSKPLALGNNGCQWYYSIVMKVLCIMKVLKDVTNARWRAQSAPTGIGVSCS